MYTPDLYIFLQGKDNKHFVIYQELFTSCAFVILVIFCLVLGVHLFVIAFYYAVEDYSEEKQIYVITVQIHFESTTKDKP